MKITITTSAKTQDVSQLVTTAKWSGDYQNAARELSLSLVSTPSDERVPAADCPLGSAVQLYEADGLLFDGYLVSRTKNTEAATMELTCLDRGLYLKRNRVSKKYVGKTPEQIVADLAGEFGITVGDVVRTGIAITRNFFGVALYDIIMTAYTLASRQTGVLYHIGFRGAALCVTPVEAAGDLPLIRGKSNLITAATTESIENMVNAVGIYDANDKPVQTVEASEAVKLYGRMQEYLKQTKEDNQLSAAKKLLEERGVSQKITVDCLGDTRNTAGGAVAVQEPYTGLYGLFYIENDSHEWKRGQYYNKLTLSFKRMMDEKEAGSEVTK